MKRCSTSYVIKEKQIKTTVRYQHIPIKIAQILDPDAPPVGVGVDQQELFHTAGGNCWLHDSLAVSYKSKPTLTTRSSSHTSRYLPKGAENLCT